MKDADSHIENLIAKHFAGECSENEESELSLWLNADEANRNYYNFLKKVFDESTIARNLEEVDTDAAWLKLKERIKNQEKSVVKPMHFNKAVLIRIAAMIILVAGIGLTIFIMQDDAGPVKFATQNEMKEVVLPDSSRAFLNRNSSLQFALAGHERKIKMTGEVFFEVKHSDQAFIVEAEGLVIRDIGTAFTVNARKRNSISVQVTEGEVEVGTEDLKPIRLTEGERSVYDKPAKTLTELSVADPNALSYKTKIFVFENASLPAVIEKINEVYNTSIIIGENLKYCRITSTFKNESVESILQVIAEVLHLRIVKQDSLIILEGPPCE